MSKDIHDYCVYFILSTPRFVKIGYTKNLYARFSHYRTSSPIEPFLLFTISAEDECEAKEIESYIHKNYACYRQRGEWFEADNIIQDFIDMLDDERNTISEYKDKIVIPDEVWNYAKKISEKSGLELYLEVILFYEKLFEASEDSFYFYDIVDLCNGVQKIEVNKDIFYEQSAI